MKNFSKTLLVLLVFCTLTIVQASASPFASLKIEKNNCQFVQTKDTYSKISCFKTWISSFFNTKDYVLEDSLLNNYMLGRTDIDNQLSNEEEIRLLSNYMYGKKLNKVAHFRNF